MESKADKNFFRLDFLGAARQALTYRGLAQIHASIRAEQVKSVASRQSVTTGARVPCVPAFANSRLHLVCPFFATLDLPSFSRRISSLLPSPAKPLAVFTHYPILCLHSSPSRTAGDAIGLVFDPTKPPYAETAESLAIGLVRTLIVFPLGIGR